MALILRAEKGAPLTTAEIDGNFSYLKGLCDGLQAGVVAESIQSISVDADGIKFIGTEATVWGPFAVPVPLYARGKWATAMAYKSGSLIQADANLLLATVDHVSTVVDDDMTNGKLATVYSGPTAAQVAYDNATSGLASVDTQAALDEIVARVVALEAH